jgi:hypothetical protein
MSELVLSVAVLVSYIGANAGVVIAAQLFVIGIVAPSYID